MREREREREREGERERERERKREREREGERESQYTIAVTFLVHPIASSILNFTEIGYHNNSMNMYAVIRTSDPNRLRPITSARCEYSKLVNPAP